MRKKIVTLLSLLIPIIMMGQNVNKNMENIQIPQLNRDSSKVTPPGKTDANDNHLCIYKSHHSVEETIDRIEEQLRDLNIPVFARFDHGKNAKEVNLDLRPTQVIVFGAPAVGTKLMQANQSIAIELPLRIAVWEDTDHCVWAAFPRMDKLTETYHLQNNPVTGKIQTLLQNLVIKAGSIH